MNQLRYSIVCSVAVAAVDVAASGQPLPQGTVPQGLTCGVSYVDFSCFAGTGCTNHVALNNSCNGVPTVATGSGNCHSSKSDCSTCSCDYGAAACYSDGLGSYYCY